MHFFNKRKLFYEKSYQLFQSFILPYNFLRICKEIELIHFGFSNNFELEYVKKQEYLEFDDQNSPQKETFLQDQPIFLNFYQNPIDGNTIYTDLLV